MSTISSSHPSDRTASKQLIFILIGAVAGLLTGAFAPSFGIQTGILGDLFLNALKMMVIPLVVSSIIVGVSNLKDSSELGRIGVSTILYYLATTTIAIIVGLAVVNIIQPGSGVAPFSGELPENIKNKDAFSILDVIRGMIHPNLVEAAADFKILPIIIASILFGVAIVRCGDSAKPVLDVVNAFNDVVMKIVLGIMYFAPIGIFGLIAHRIGMDGGGEAVFDLVVRLAKYCFAVVAGLLIHALIVLPVILKVFTGRSFLNYFNSMSQALMTAFATASSSSTLPVSLQCVKKSGVSDKTGSVVLPLGATVNMDGTALYEAVAALFIAQCYGIDLGLSQQLIIVLTASLASIGAAGIPEAGLVTMILVLQSVGLPTEGIGLILAVDWILDRCRTSVNVWGDTVGAAVVDKIGERN